MSESEQRTKTADVRTEAHPTINTASHRLRSMAEMVAIRAVSPETAAKAFQKAAALVDDLLEALEHIAFKPLMSDMEASYETCLAEAVRIARSAIAKSAETSHD